MIGATTPQNPRRTVTVELLALLGEAVHLLQSTDLKDAIVELAETYKAGAKDLEKRQADISEAIAELDDKSKANEAKAGELAAAEQKLLGLTAEQQRRETELGSRIAALIEREAAADETASALAADIARHDAEHEARSSELAQQHEERSAALTSEISEKRTGLQERQRDLDRLAKDLKAAQAKTEAMQADLETRQEAARQSQAEAQSVKAQYERELADLHATITARLGR